MDDSIPRSILILCLILLGGFFASSETAFSYCNKMRIKKRAEEGEKRAIRANYVLNRFEKALSTLLIGTNVCYVCANTLAASMFIRLFGTVGAAVSTVVMTVLIFIFAETIPKNIARANSDELACIFAAPISALMIVLTPLSLIFSGIAGAVKLILPRRHELPSMTEDEFQSIIENIEDEGLIEPEESKLIQSAIEFSDTCVRDIMMPLDKMTAIEIGDDFENIKKLILAEKYSRIPVYAGTPDRIVGVLQTKDCLVSIMHGREIDVSAVMKLPYCVPPDTKLDAMFEGLCHRRSHFAVITGEDGRALGFITMEDVMEELVGEIYDEDDEVVHTSAAKEARQ